jgi:hypothetical protein
MHLLSTSGTIMIVTIHINTCRVLMLIIAILRAEEGATARASEVLHMIFLV